MRSGTFARRELAAPFPRDRGWDSALGLLRDGYRCGLNGDTRSGVAHHRSRRPALPASRFVITDVRRTPAVSEVPAILAAVGASRH